MALTAAVGWIVVRARLRHRALVDHLASLPLAFPGLVLGLAILVFYLHVDIGVYGTLWILLIAYVTRFLPYGMRASTAAMVQVHRELEESAAMSGAAWLATFRHVVLPLLKPGPARRLGVHRDRLGARAVELDPAVQPGTRGGVGGDLGAVGERPVRRALGGRRAC